MTYSYDTLGNMIAAYDQNGRELFYYSYDDLGRRTALCPDGTMGNQAMCTQYGYDAVGRTNALNLTGSDAQTLAFQFNAAGQIKQRQSGNDAYAWSGAVNVNRAYGVNGLNQYTSAGSTNFVYDPHGNLTQSSGNSYSYDSFNRLGEYNGGYNAGNWL